MFGEDENGCAHHVMGIVHNSANYLPDLLEHMADTYPNLTVKNGVLCRGSDIETTTMAAYKEQVFVFRKMISGDFCRFYLLGPNLQTFLEFGLS